jgi:hypothetical protein
MNRTLDLLLLLVVPITVQTIRPTARVPRGWIQQPDVLDPDTLESAAKKEKKSKKKEKTTTRRREDDDKGGVEGNPRNAKSTIIIVVALENTLIVFFFSFSLLFNFMAASRG